jgi:hypothetical protein
VGNHIANLSYPTGSPDQRVPMLNGKYILFSGNKFDSANIINANLYSKNGVYHIIDKFIPRKDNCWEFVNNSTDYTLFKSALISLNYTFFDSTKATQIATDPLTGNPIWDSTNAKVIRNSFLDNVLNIADETNEYTLIVLTDGSFTNEFNKITPWFQTRTGNIDSSNNLASYHLIKDLAISGSKSMAQLPDTLVSKFGVKIPIDKSKIVASYKTSNGYVHVMSQVDFNLTDKFPPIIIQGENPTSFATTDRSFYTYYRTRTNPNTGVIFKDILMQNYGFTNYFIRYSIPAVPAMRYNVSWVAVNDVQTKPLWTQRLAIGNISDTTFIADTIAYKNYSEVPLGQFQLDSYRNRLNLFLIGTSSSSTSGGTNSISLDYIKLTPAF